GAFSLRRKRTSPRPSPRASKCRAGLASDPGTVTWGKGCRQYVSGQQSDSLQTRPWQRGLALFRPWWSVPYRLKNHDERVVAPGVRTSWMWDARPRHREGRSPTHGYEPTREAAMAAFAKSGRRE